MADARSSAPWGGLRLLHKAYPKGSENCAAWLLTQDCYVTLPPIAKRRAGFILIPP